MKAAQLTAIGSFQIADIPRPNIINDTDVLIKMAVVGVCGSDVHYYNTGRIGNRIVQFPFIIGHEGAGTIEKVGPAVTNLTPGQRVAIDPAISCHKCDQCTSGREHTCRNMKFLSCPDEAPGNLCEYIVMPQQCCYKIHDSTTFDQAALSEPFSIGVYSAQRAGSLQNATIGILGQGPIGLSVLIAAQTKGIKSSYVTDKIDARLNTARNLGVTWTGNPDSINIIDEIIAHEPTSLDVVFECCGQQEALDQAVNLIKPGGRLIIVGIPEPNRISFDTSEFRHKELEILYIRRQNNCVQTALDLIETGQVNLDAMATHHFNLDQTKEAFDLVANYRDGVIKAIIKI